MREVLEEKLARILGRVRRRHRAFDARRKDIGRLGLPEVRDHRLRELERDHAQWLARLAEQDAGLPELTALLVLRVSSLAEEETGG